MFWTTGEIAKATGLTRQHIARLIRQGIIKGEKKGHDWWVSEDEARRVIEAYKKDK